jgi:hypothetical protein
MPVAMSRTIRKAAPAPMTVRAPSQPSAVHAASDLHDLGGVQCARLREIVLPGGGDDLVGAGPEAIPFIAEAFVHLLFFRRRHPLAIGFVSLGEVPCPRIEVLLDVDHLAFIGPGQIITQHRAVARGLGAHLAKQTDVGQPVGVDFLSRLVKRSHLVDGEDADGGKRDQENGDEDDEFGADREPGEHGGVLRLSLKIRKRGTSGRRPLKTGCRGRDGDEFQSDWASSRSAGSAGQKVY